MRYHQTWIAAENTQVGELYREVSGHVIAAGREACRDAWQAPPAQTASAMNLNGWGPPSVDAHIVVLQAAISNRASVVSWNTDKRYLADLAEAASRPAVDCVRTGRRGHTAGMRCVRRQARRLGGARDARRFDAAEIADACVHAAQLAHQGRAVLVQPYVAGADRRGETAVVFLADRYSHAIRKGPILREGPTIVDGLFAVEDIASRTRRCPSVRSPSGPSTRSRSTVPVCCTPGRSGARR